MDKFSGRFGIIRKVSEEQVQKWSGEFLALLKSTIQKEAEHVEEYVRHLQALNEGIEKEALAKASNPQALEMNFKGIFLDEGKRILD